MLHNVSSLYPTIHHISTHVPYVSLIYTSFHFFQSQLLPPQESVIFFRQGGVTRLAVVGFCFGADILLECAAIDVRARWPRVVPPTSACSNDAWITMSTFYVLVGYLFQDLFTSCTAAFWYLNVLCFNSRYMHRSAFADCKANMWCCRV